MTLVGWAVLAATIVIGVVDWVSVAARVKWLEYATKPAFMLGLIALAVALQPASSTERAFFVVALALGLLSDVFLMLPTDMFLAGLGAAWSSTWPTSPAFAPAIFTWDFSSLRP